jgi:hypothetical protein
MQTLIRLYYVRHGFQAINVLFVSPLAKLALISLGRIHDNLPPTELKDVRSSLFLANSGLHDQGNNYYAAKTLYHVIKRQLRPEEASNLPRIVTESAADNDDGG